MHDIYLPIGLRSDGCTFPGILGIFKKLLGSDRYRDACMEHDFLRRYGVVKWYKANWILFLRIFSHGLVGKLRAPFYLLFTTISYPWYSRTESLPKEWAKYENYYR